jgi:hypothetical protein
MHALSIYDFAAPPSNFISEGKEGLRSCHSRVRASRHRGEPPARVNRISFQSPYTGASWLRLHPSVNIVRVNVKLTLKP